MLSSLLYSKPHSPPSRGYAPLRACALVAILGGTGLPALAVPTGCELSTISTGVVFDKALPTVSRDAVPYSVNASAPIVARCASSNGEVGSYRWTMTLRTLSLTMLSGTTSSTVLASVGRRFIAASSTFEVSEGVVTSGAQRETTVNTTGQLWNLSNRLSAGKYRLSQVFDISEEYCKWTGNHMTCKSQGTVRQYSAYYTLTVVDPPVTPPGPTPVPPPVVTEPPPATGSGSSPTPGRGVKPNPWTVRGYAAKHRCEKCEELRNGW